MSTNDSPATLWIDLRQCQTSALHYLGMLLEYYPDINQSQADEVAERIGFYHQHATHRVCLLRDAAVKGNGSARELMPGASEVLSTIEAARVIADFAFHNAHSDDIEPEWLTLWRQEVANGTDDV